MTKHRVGGSLVAPATPASNKKSSNIFSALADSDTESDTEVSTAPPTVSSSHQQSQNQPSANPGPNETVEDVRSRWAQMPHRPPSEFPTLFARGKQQKGPLPMRLDLNRPLFQDDAQQQQQQQQQFPTGGPYSPKTPPFFPDTFSKIETIETSYPYAQCTPPQPTNDSSTVDISDAPLPPSATPIETPTITMAMRIKETLDTVTANRSAAAQVSNEERVNRIKKGLEGLSFFRRPLEASS